MCENIDWNVGRVLNKLDELAIAQNTIVVYFSDNGPNGWRWNDGMKGKKGSTDEGGLRSPFFIRWPNAIAPGKKIPHIAGAIDLLPTLADLAAIPLTSKKPLDGVSIKPLLLGTAKTWPQRAYFSTWKGRVSVRTEKYRLDHQGKLFDMQTDPGQRGNVSKQHPELAAELRAAAVAWKKETTVATPKRPFTVGHPGTRDTHLPARDAVAHGTIKRSSVHPNCSFFTNWTSVDDSITWDIEVLTPGSYDAQLYYTCKQENIGAQLELSFEGNQIQQTVRKAHDPPLLGEAVNRVPRGESFTKAFRPMTLGTMILPNRRGTLTLRATEIAGNQAVDVRYVVLTRTGE
jgi:hypothetical protein